MNSPSSPSHNPVQQPSRSRNSRAAVVSYLRTPFVKTQGSFQSESALSLSVRLCTEVLSKLSLDPADNGEVIWGSALPQLRSSNLARDIVLFSGFPRTVPGYTLNRGSASSLTAIQGAIDAINAGRAQVVLAGGADVASHLPATLTEAAQALLTKLSQARSLTERLQVFRELKPLSLFQQPMQLLEPYTGKSLAEHCEMLALKQNISREDQDAFAAESHRKAAHAMRSGYLKDEVVPVWAGARKNIFVDADDLILPDSTSEFFAAFSPIINAQHGTLTVGNTSPFADGAAVLVLANEEYARNEGFSIMGYAVDAVTVGVEPNERLLTAPAHAIPMLLQRNGLGIADVGTFQIHEAFAAQTLATLDLMADKTFVREELEEWAAGAGWIPPEKFNQDGGSLAYGDPFGATGMRMVGQALNIAKRMNERYAVVATPTSGGLGQALLLETAD